MFSPRGVLTLFSNGHMKIYLVLFLGPLFLLYNMYWPIHITAAKKKKKLRSNVKTKKNKLSAVNFKMCDRGSLIYQYKRRKKSRPLLVALTIVNLTHKDCCARKFIVRLIGLGGTTRGRISRRFPGTTRVTASFYTWNGKPSCAQPLTATDSNLYIDIVICDV